ncbi:N-acetylneuraminate 9-O-acetyltransferase [Entomortierella parvispora]|uniref:N-acetylneuraminate 9-O-acetyltransferase n=1 Tax=Entomortierella parvispora TaxID=205924 RepID=A0A9P3HH74_9FUNG|nr:N-acetylneuraminate 9-O-acetyltransferase [Entomortierella parvispora]
MHAAPSFTSSSYQKGIQALFWALAAALLALAAVRPIVDPADKTHCESLLNHGGSWIDTQRTQWQPKGCMLKNYEPTSATSCLGKSRVVMIGDSVVRQLFYSVVKKFIPDFATDRDKHANIIHTDPTSGTTFEFYWDPVLNTTTAQELLSGQYQNAPVAQTPTIFLVGSGMWFLRYREWSGGLEEWKKTMANVVKVMNDPDSASPGKHLFISSIQSVNPDKLSDVRYETLRLKDIEEMNIYLKSITRNTVVTVPFVWNKMTETAMDATRDGLHFAERVMSAEADVMLNFVCNNQLPKVAPMAATCCYEYPANSGVQSLMLALLMIWLPIGFIVQTRYNEHPLAAFFPGIGVLRAMAVMAGSILYMYYSDRTTLFAKIGKAYSTPTFMFLCFLSLVAGLATLKRAEKDQPFLSRDQTDEWKGWMQIAILIYHYMGASSVSVIYNPVRVFVASYLFMTGFGHFVFYYKKADFGFRRVAMILTRLNLLTVLLAYTMDTTYISYYFAPLVSFFYLVIYGMMYLGHTHNHKPVFMIGKIVATAILSASMIYTPIVLDTTFAVLKFFFGITWSAAEWRFRLKLDVWIVFVGSLFSYGFIMAQELSITAHPHWAKARTVAIISSVIGLLGFFLFESTMEKREYNLHHPYISWIPILSFVVLRNSTADLRNTTSTFYAYIGRCSLETFICQFHMWLAADTKGLLMVSPWLEGAGSWSFNLILSTILFIVISNQLSGATGELTDWLITGREPKVKGLPAPPPALPLVNTTPRQRPVSAQGTPVPVKRQSVMLSPIAISAGAVGPPGPDALNKLMDASLRLETATSNELSESGSSGDIDLSNSLDKSPTQGESKQSARQQESVSLLIESNNNGSSTNNHDTSRERDHSRDSDAVPVTFKSLWAQPTWKVGIFFGIIWLLNFWST